MPINDITVKWVWVDEKDKQVGVHVLLSSGKTQDIALCDLESLRGRLMNAAVTSYGVRAKPGVTLERKLIKRTDVKGPVATYTLMHADDTVCRVLVELGRVEVVNEDKLPFALRGIVITVPLFMEWLNARIDNLARVYMNKVYVLRKVGRDREKILRDSCGISPIDNFWVQRSDVSTSWSELKRQRDVNRNLANTALTGEIAVAPDFDKVESDTTTLFATKGAFPKAVLNGYILKKDNKAECEVVAYQLGKMLGVSVAQAEKTERAGVVGCKIFTSEAVSMAHVRDFLHLTDYASGIDDEHRAIYGYFAGQGREDILAQLERLYIFNYLVENTDFHFENFGLLYDSNSFEIKSVAPGFDFNNAFDGYNDPGVYYAWIKEHLPEFMHRHGDIAVKLCSARFSDVLAGIEDLSTTQKASIKQRAEYLCSL